MFLKGVSVVLCGDGQDVKGATIAWATKVEKDHLNISLLSGIMRDTME